VLIYMVFTCFCHFPFGLSAAAIVPIAHATGESEPLHT